MNNEEKVFEFNFVGTIGGYGVVAAKNKKEALEKIKNKDYDDIIDTWDMEIKEVTEIKESI